MGGFNKDKNDDATEKDNVTWSDPQNQYNKIAVFEADHGVPVANELAFTYTKLIKVKNCNITKNGSTSNFVLQDPAGTEVGDNDGLYGYTLDAVTNNRYHLMVVLYGAGVSLPTQGDAYAQNNSNFVIFSGFVKGDVSLEAGGAPGDRVELQAVGIEQGLNDFQVKGTVHWDFTLSINSDAKPDSEGRMGVAADPNNTAWTPRYKAIFNENGNPDKMNFGDVVPTWSLTGNAGRGDTNTAPYFNKSGEGEVQYWSIGQMVNYIIQWCIGYDGGVFDEFLPEEFIIRSKFANYLHASIEIPTLLYSEYVSHVDVDGMGAWDALIEVMRQSYTHDIAGRYDQEGKFILIFKTKYDAERDARESRTYLCRGKRGEDFDVNCIVKNSNLGLSREENNLGRVIILGKPVKLNVLFTNCPGDDSSTIKMSTQEADYSPIPSNAVSSFADYPKIFYKRSLSDKGLSGGLYKFSNLQFIKNEDSFPVETDLEERFLESKLFQFFEIPEILDELQVAFSEKNKIPKDYEIYTVDKIFPDAATPYMFVKPIEKCNNVGARLSTEESGAIEIFAKGSEADFSTYNLIEHYSPAESEINTKGYWVKGGDYDMVPLFVKCSVVSHYRLKGIDQIAGFDPKIHSTKYIENDDFELSINYKAANYQNTTSGKKVDANLGHFILTAADTGLIPLDSGISDSNNVEPLTRIKAYATGMLNKYVNIPQNSGELTLNGIQEPVQLGKFLDEVVGGSGAGNRTFAFPTTITEIFHDFELLETRIVLGNINDPTQEILDA